MTNALLVFVVLVLAICRNAALGAAAPLGSSSSHAVRDPPVVPSSAAGEFLQAHNQARAAVGVRPLKWSGDLANASSRLARYQRNKMGCQFANLTDHKYGANQFWVSEAVTPRIAVETWVKEKNYYDYASNTCAANYMCEVYKKVVWRNSSELGCAQATCKDQTSLNICFYNPPGNYVEERPY